MQNQSCIYLDHAATTPLLPCVAEAMQPFLQAGLAGAFGNPNSVHSKGRQTFSALEDARMKTARALGANRPDEIVFTSGATEADNAAVVGMALAARQARNLAGNHAAPHVLMSKIEHDAVLHTAKYLRLLGFEVDYVQNSATGHVTVEALEAALHPDTVVASIMMANNEVGTVQDIASLAAAAHAHGVLFHTDAVQALGKVPVHVGDLGVDAASFSAHKVGGPKGVGVLYLKAHTAFTPLALGGGQERGLRSGTQNVAAIVGCAQAVQHAQENRHRFQESSMVLRDQLYARLSSLKCVVPSVSVAPQSMDFLPHIVNVCVRGFESQTMILQLDLAGICVSGGSACSSGSLDPSHVLTALGIQRNLAQGSLRVSMGYETTQADVDAFYQAFLELVGA